MDGAFSDYLGAASLDLEHISIVSLFFPPFVSPRQDFRRRQIIEVQSIRTTAANGESLGPCLPVCAANFLEAIQAVGVENYDIGAACYAAVNVSPLSSPLPNRGFVCGG